mgnify:FL=1
MTDIEVVHYRKGDALKLPGYIPNEQQEKLDALFLSGDSYTGEVAEVPVFCAGISLYWPGHAEVWLIMGKPENQYIGCLAKMKDLLELVIQKHRLFRISAHVAIDNEEANRLVLHLGFKLEVTLECYGPDREAYNHYGKLIWQPQP